MKKAKGFTLIELLIVVAILAILMAAAIVAIDPLKQLGDANNSNRWSGITTIINAVYQNIIDNGGEWVCEGKPLPSTSTNMSSLSGEYDICSCLVPSRLGSLPIDPQKGNYEGCANYDTKYSIVLSEGRITITATEAQLGEVISVSR